MPSAASPRPARAAARFWLVLGLLALATEVAGRIALPPARAYYRGWAWAKREAGPLLPDAAPGPFFANVTYAGRTFGDLANSARVRNLRLVRPQRFTTDGYGYRNPPGREFGPWDVVVVGDSFAAGAGLSDADTFPAQLETVLGRPVYNGAPQSPVSLFDEARFRERPPDVLVWAYVERWLDDGAAFAELTELEPPSARWGVPRAPAMAPAQFDARARFTQPFSLGVRWGSHFFGLGRWTLLRSAGAHAVGRDGHTLFNAESLAAARRPLARFAASEAAAGAAALRAWCDALDVRMLLLLVPDKATVHRDLLPDRQGRDMLPPGVLLRRFQAALDAQGVEYVDLLTAYEGAAAGGDALYWPDDTHWSPWGARVAAEATAARLRRE